MMLNFNIENSKIDQFNNTGNNYKQTSKEGNNAISEQGSVVQTEGTENKVGVNKPNDSLLVTLWNKIKGLFTGSGS